MRFLDLATIAARCAACGREGRDARVRWERFAPAGVGEWIRAVSVGQYELLPLDNLGLCEACHRHSRQNGDRG